MGSKTWLASILSQPPITGTDREVALTHEINRQSAVKQILFHVFFLSKFGFLKNPMKVGHATSQYIRATGENQAAHCAPGQLFTDSKPIQNLISISDELSLELENLFGETDVIHRKFNLADSRAEENGLRDALLEAGTFVAEAARYTRFGQIEVIYPLLKSAFEIYQTRGDAAYRMAAVRQQQMIKPNDEADLKARQETIGILNLYGEILASADPSHETVLGFYPKDLWQDYRKAAKLAGLP